MSKILKKIILWNFLIVSFLKSEEALIEVLSIEEDIDMCIDLEKKEGVVCKKSKKDVKTLINDEVYEAVLKINDLNRLKRKLEIIKTGLCLVPLLYGLEQIVLNIEKGMSVYEALDDSFYRITLNAHESINFSNSDILNNYLKENPKIVEYYKKSFKKNIHNIHFFDKQCRASA